MKSEEMSPNEMRGDKKRLNKASETVRRKETRRN